MKKTLKEKSFFDIFPCVSYLNLLSNEIKSTSFSCWLWHVKRCIIRFIYVIILSFLFVFTKRILLFYHCILLLYILSISIQCPFISIVYFSIYILYLIICIH